MAAPVLTASQQKASLSGKKNKKKVMKNVLNLPTSVKVECHVADVNETDRLCKIIERLLSDARLLGEQNTKSKKEELSPDELKKKEQASNIRNQLALGVNDLNRCVKKKSISAVLLESEIQPKFLIQHINLLCHHNQIPFIHLPGLRTITRNSLGFPCIALGFKKDCTHFTEAISEIQSIATTQTVSLDNTTENSVQPDDSDDDSVILQSVVKTKSKTKEDDTPFTYLYRSSINERVFIPEQHQSEVKLSKQLDDGFISIGSDNEVNTRPEKQSTNLGLSSNLVRKQKKREKLLNLKDLNESESDDDDEDEDSYKMPKKKSKKDWVIDTVGTKQKFKYSPANILKVHSNPNRVNRKNKHKKK